MREKTPCNILYLAYLPCTRPKVAPSGQNVTDHRPEALLQLVISVLSAKDEGKLLGTSFWEQVLATVLAMCDV